MSTYKMDEIPMLLWERLGIPRQYESSSYIRRFSALETNLDRVNFVYKDLKKYNLFPKFIQDGKNDVTANQTRENGNRQFALGHFRKALETYTCSIATAKTKDVLALAYANRSACLYRLNLYKDCITDIERALLNNYPTEKVLKLIERRTQALKLKQSVETYHERTPKIPDSERSPLIQCAKNCVKIENNEVFGRHIVSTRDIQIGEVLSVEEPYASILKKDLLIHCHDCLKVCYNPIPCENCTQALFCSDDCKQNALNTYYKYECPILLSFAVYEVHPLLVVVLKIALLAKEEYIELKTFTYNRDEFYRSDRYKECHSLKSATKKRPIMDLFQRTVFVAVIFNLLENTENSILFFSDQTVEAIFKEVMLLQLQTAPLNIDKISEFLQTMFCYEQNDFGLGLYPFFSLFNHSCCRNVDRYYYGSTLVLRASNTIKKGQQCFVSYGPSYSTNTRADRQKFLNDIYSFNCNCKACLEDWNQWILDFEIDTMEVFVMDIISSTANAHIAKQFLPFLISRLKQCERCEPWGNAVILKGLIFQCYNSLGNKRHL